MFKDKDVFVRLCGWEVPHKVRAGHELYIKITDIDPKGEIRPVLEGPIMRFPFDAPLVRFVAVERAAEPCLTAELITPPDDIEWAHPDTRERVPLTAHPVCAVCRKAHRPLEAHWLHPECVPTTPPDKETSSIDMRGPMDREETRALVAAQLRGLRGDAMVRCGRCERRLPVRFTFRCFDCGVWYCERCMGNHLGRPRVQHDHVEIRALRATEEE